MGVTSKGCRTCIRRKVRCDQRRPCCLRCEKGHFNCEGYIKQHRFVDEVTRTVRRAQKTSSPSNEPLSPPLTDPSRPPSTGTTRIPSPLASAGSPREMSLVAFKEDIAVSFLLCNLFAGDTPAARPWIETLAEDRSPMSKQSLLAIGNMYFGRIHHQTGIMREGSIIYGKALRSLHETLQNKEKAWSITTLLSVMTLEMYEFLAPSPEAGWLQHAGGVGRLIELRGPESHQAPYSRYLFQCNRVPIVLECMVKQKRCFLESPQWKSVPWALEPESKCSEMYLHDILCSVPGMMEDAKALSHFQGSQTDFKALKYALAIQIQFQLSELYAWRALWEEANPLACHEIPAPSATASIFPTVLRYSNLHAASEITMYNTIQLHILELGAEIIGPAFSCSSSTSSFNQNKPSLNPLILPGQAPNSQAIATEISRSVDYHLSGFHANLGAFLLLFPLRVAHNVFEDGTAERLWLKVQMRRVAERGGWEIGRNIGGNAAVGGFR